MTCEKCGDNDAKPTFRYCLKCLRAVRAELKAMHAKDDVRTLSRQGTEEIGRSLLASYKTIGGAPPSTDHDAMDEHC